MDATSGDQSILYEDLELQGFLRAYENDFEENMSQMIERFSHLKIDDPRDHFPLGALPRELVLEINRFLPGSSSLALAATCRDMRALIPKVSQKDGASWEKFAQYMDRDALARACKSEVNNDDQTMKTCSGCKTLHPVQRFSAVQLVLPPRVRKCRGREGVLYFGWNGEDRFSWECLKKIMLIKTTQNPHYSPLVDHRELNLMESLSVPSTDEGFVLKSRQMMQTYRPGVNLDRGFVEILGQWADQKLCPHTTIGAIRRHLIQGLLNLRSASGRPVASDTGILIWKCAVHNCRSWVEMEISRYPSSFRTPIFVLSTISGRNLGKLRDPNDPLWIAQIERPRPTGWLDLSV